MTVYKLANLESLAYMMVYMLIKPRYVGIDGGYKLGRPGVVGTDDGYN